MEQREIDIKNRWSAIKSRPDESIKQIARDLYDGNIYTDRHCPASELMNRFMVLIFMGPKEPSKPTRPNAGGNVMDDRDNQLYDVLQFDSDMIEYEKEMKWHAVEQEYYKKEYLPSIGLIYEYFHKAGPLAYNGGPMFMSCALLNHDDTKKLFEYYEKYKELRKEIDNF